MTGSRDDMDFIREHDRAAAFARSLHRLEVIAAIAGRVRRVGVVASRREIVATATLVLNVGANTLGKFARMR